MREGGTQYFAGNLYCLPLLETVKSEHCTTYVGKYVMEGKTYQESEDRWRCAGLHSRYRWRRCVQRPLWEKSSLDWFGREMTLQVCRWARVEDPVRMVSNEDHFLAIERPWGLFVFAVEAYLGKQAGNVSSFLESKLNLGGTIHWKNVRLWYFSRSGTYLDGKRIGERRRRRGGEVKLHAWMPFCERG